MKSIKLFMMIFITVLLVPIEGLNTQAYTVSMTTKAALNFEVLDAQLTSESLTIVGWAFINENQHYNSTLDHSIQLEFISTSESFVINASLINLNMTSAYEQLGMPFCAADVYFSSTCNYTYNYVGFTVTIPLSQFKLGEKYSTNIIVLAYSSQTYLKTPLYYPISAPVQIQVGDYLYSIISKLDDTLFKIIETPIFARKTPGKAATIWTSGTNCSLTYGNRLYFKLGSNYTRILSRYVTENQTFYEINATLDSCVDMRRRIIEGTTLYPVWISGMFVEYSGSPLEINSLLINSKPVLTVDNHTILQSEEVNMLDYAKCYDPEEGDLSAKIQIESTDFINRAGTYYVTYYVEDKYGYFDRKTIYITVIGVDNDPPWINATDIYVNQYDAINYFKDVSAEDVQDGDLTSYIKLLNSVDTTQIEDQELCYSVTDFGDATTIKCVSVHIYSNIITLSKFRFVSRNNLFYQDVIPNRWIGKEISLQSMLDSEVILNTVSLY